MVFPLFLLNVPHEHPGVSLDSNCHVWVNKPQVNLSLFVVVLCVFYLFTHSFHRLYLSSLLGPGPLLAAGLCTVSALAGLGV